jgi:AAA+ ATPase superfamily predicted ATPase
MSSKRPENPFPVTTYLGAENFCDRQKETSLLISHMQNGNSTTLMAIRRIGKTGLIKHVLTQLPKGWKGIYIDILETENLNQFLNILTTSIINSVPEKSGLGRIFWDFVKSLRPVISFDSLTGAPQASFDIKTKEVESNINSVFQFLEKQDFNTVIAIDEFQQILKYPEQNTDAWLRTRIQQLKKVVFIFSGSQQYLITELFTSPKRPFFRSTQMMKLEKLDQETYCAFIKSLFKKYNKKISSEIVNDIIEWSNLHTFYVQQLCNRVFSATSEKVTTEIWKHQAYLLLQEQEQVFFIYRNMLTNPQWQLLKAIAHEGTVYQLTSKAFLDKYHLGSSASVLRSVKTILKYELVYTEFDKDGNQYYCVYDVLFHRWTLGR